MNVFISVLVLLLGNPTWTWASEPTNLSSSENDSLRNTLEKVKSSGASGFVSSHRSCEGEAWSLVFFSARRGYRVGTEIGLRVYPFLDGSCAQEMSIALATGLKVNSRDFLSLSGQVKLTQGDLSDICGDVVPNDSEDYDPSSDIKELGDRERSLQKVTDQTLGIAKKDCLSGISKSKSALKNLKKSP